ncbi:YjgN family protein [Massilia sp. GCM10023247]|uniref:YjgN family protein n=1 Tax=Massilia sp. GCM10023247 TaxID=3252643 RepID=UPI00361F8F78
MLPADLPVALALPGEDALVPPMPRTYSFQFTGSGREYFRIWVINLLLSLATLGIYSAWAKVRRLQYFDRNTMLAGAVFDFHGAPAAILRGRVLAVLLLAAYQYAFGFSLAFGLAVVGVLLLALPYMMRGALRFRLGNTSYRGLRFHFTGSVPRAYGSYLAPIAIFLLPGVMVAVIGESPWSALPVALYLGWPAMYGWMKRYQYGHVAYGDRHSSTDLSIYEFFRIYASGLLLATTFILVVFALGMAAVPLKIMLPAEAVDALLGTAIGCAAALMAYLLLGPYQQVRVLNLCLPGTRFPAVRFVSTLSARALARLQVKNLLLTLFTLGLYRPFAVVSAYRFRLAHLMLEVEADGGFDHVLAAVKPAGGAAGDGTADFLGVDLSW